MHDPGQRNHVLNLEHSMVEPPIFLIALSGPTSAGKMTLAYLLSRVFAPYISHILHSDYFCREFDRLSKRGGYLDADGPAGVDFVRKGEVLDYVKTHEGTTLERVRSWQADVFPRQDERALKMSKFEFPAHVSAVTFAHIGIITQIVRGQRHPPGEF